MAGKWRISALAAAMALAVAAQAAEPVARIEIDAAAAGPRVNPHMYGIFYEELNHAGDGGLYAEMVRNRSFEDANVPEGMHLENGVACVEGCRDRIAWPPRKEAIPGWTARGGAKLSLDDQQPVNSAQKHALRIEATDARNRGGAANGGWWGMSVQQGESYLLSLYARGDANFAGEVMAVLENEKGEPLGPAVSLGPVRGEWNRLKCRLTAAVTDHNARLSIYSTAPGTFWLDVVSLFPAKTWENRPNGLRADIVQMLKDLKPGFMRFPGGCITEGLTLEQGYQWKNTIGDIDGRPGVWNSMWSYRRSDGLGYHELLQLCEDIGAAPMFTLNVGVACTIHTNGPACPMDQMQRYVDDAVDAIEYANGPADSKWGAVRAKNGHAAPFNLKYVNIGNELRNAAYAERYPLFYKAIKAKWPDVTTIAYDGVGRPKAPIEMRDLHDYRDDKWFFSMMQRFDKYDRSGPKIANLELAVRTQRNHTLHNALLEAAYMIGLERNADVVQLVAYAPLLWNTNLTGAWQPDLIHFNNHQVYGTPSYYVQKLFMHNRPDAVLKTTVMAAGGPATQPENAPAVLYALAGRDAGGDLVIKAANLLDRDCPAQIAISGLAAAPKAVTATVLTSTDEMDRNSFEAPTKVSPKSAPLQGAGATFDYVFPKHSMVVLRLKTAQE